MRDESNRLARRLDRLELMDQVASAQKHSPSPAARVSAAEVPALTVVKLKPRVEPAPRVDTKVDVVEPAREVVDELAASAPGKTDRDADEVDPGVGDQIFDAGLEALKTGNVAGGVEKLQRFAAENPKHPKADNALYFAGLGLMGLNDYEDASRSFQQLIDSYPAGDAVLEAMLKLAECRMRMNQPKDARVIYQKVVSSFPGTSAASLAESKLGVLAQNAATGSP